MEENGKLSWGSLSEEEQMAIQNRRGVTWERQAGSDSAMQKRCGAIRGQTDKLTKLAFSWRERERVLQECGLVERESMEPFILPYSNNN